MLQFSRVCDRWGTGFRDDVRTAALRDNLTAFRSRGWHSLERLTVGLGGLAWQSPSKVDLIKELSCFYSPHCS